MHGPKWRLHEVGPNSDSVWSFVIHLVLTSNKVIANTASRLAHTKPCHVNSPFKVFNGAIAWRSIDGAVVPGVNVAAEGWVPPLVGDDLTKQAPTARAIVRGKPWEVVLFSTPIGNHRSKVKVNYQPLSLTEIISKDPARKRVWEREVYMYALVIIHNTELLLKNWHENNNLALALPNF